MSVRRSRYSALFYPAGGGPPRTFTLVRETEHTFEVDYRDPNNWELPPQRLVLQKSEWSLGENRRPEDVEIEVEDPSAGDGSLI